MPSRNPIKFNHIAVEGVLKSGKTGLAQALARKLEGRAVLDRKDNPFLKDFYEEKEGAALLAQLVFLVNRYHQQAGLMQRNLFHDRVIADYLFEKDKIYAYKTLLDEELIVYEKIFNIFAEKIAKPDLTIYLQISLSTLLERVARDGSPVDRNISEKYLGDIVEAFDYFFFNYQATPLLVVKADDLDFTSSEDVDDLADKIRQTKKSPLFYVPLVRANKNLKNT